MKRESLAIITAFLALMALVMGAVDLSEGLVRDDALRERLERLEARMDAQCDSTTGQ